MSMSKKLFNVVTSNVVTTEEKVILLKELLAIASASDINTLHNINNHCSEQMTILQIAAVSGETAILEILLNCEKISLDAKTTILPLIIREKVDQVGEPKHMELVERFSEDKRNGENNLNSHLQTSDIKDLDAAGLYNTFRQEYSKKLRREQGICLVGFFRRSNLNLSTDNPYIDPMLALKEILDHGLYQNGARTKEIMIKLNWIDKNGNLHLNNPALEKAKHDLDVERNAKKCSPLFQAKG